MEKQVMKANVWTMMLRFGVFAALLAASAMAALLPDWATTLKAQSYSGYVDLQLDVQLDVPTRNPSLKAGTDADLLVTLANAGTADAHRARAVALLKGDAIATATGGCLEDPLGFPNCTFSSPLPAGGSADYLLTLAVSPLARGHLKVAVAAASDDADSVPGRELVLIDLPIQAHVNLIATSACDRPYLPKSAPLSCQVTLRNAGPAAVTMPYLYVDANGMVVSNLNCNAPRPDMCPAQLPGAWEPTVVMPGDSILLSFQLTANPAFSYDAIFLDYGAFITSGGELEDVPVDNWNSNSIPVPLFRDDFEGEAAASPTQG
jgi:hypothetical protein